jgi:hypothetical protein
LPLRLLKEHGYQLHLLATPDTEYQNLESIVFGPGGNLLDRKFHPSERLVAERDQAVTDELVRVVREERSGGSRGAVTRISL